MYVFGLKAPGGKNIIFGPRPNNVGGGNQDALPY
jgi:hypothetical protein